MEHFIQAYEACKQNQALEKTLIESLKEEEVQSLIDVCKTNKYDVSLNSLNPKNSNEGLKHLLGKDGLEACLMYACKYGDVSRVKLFIEEDVDIHFDNDYALRLASSHGHLNVMQYLVEQGADIHANDDMAVRYAAEKGHLYIVQYLIEQGADIHANDDMAVRYAAVRGRLDVVQYLVEQGADNSCQ